MSTEENSLSRAIEEKSRTCPAWKIRSLIGLYGFYSKDFWQAFTRQWSRFPHIRHTPDTFSQMRGGEQYGTARRAETKSSVVALLKLWQNRWASPRPAGPGLDPHKPFMHCTPCGVKGIPEPFSNIQACEPDAPDVIDKLDAASLLFYKN